MLSKLTHHASTDGNTVPTDTERTAIRNRVIGVVLLIVFLAGSVRLLTYDRFLPYSDYSDEVVYVASADEIRGFSDQTALRERYGALAPLYVMLNVGVHSIADALNPHPWHMPGEYLYWMRILSVVFGVLTALSVAWLGWRLAGMGAALIGGMVWALSPIIVSYNSLAIPDPWLYLTCVLAVCTAVEAVQRASVRWLALSLAFGVAAIYIKLWIFTAIIPFVLASIILVLRDRRKMLPRVALLYALGILFAIHFVLVLNPLQNTLKVNNNSDNVLSDMISITRLGNNLARMIHPVDSGSWWSLIVVALGLGALVYAKRHGLKMIDRSSLLIAGAYLVGTWWLSAGISFISLDERMRHILPASVVFIPVWAACLIQILRVAEHLAHRVDLRTLWLPRALAAGVLILLLVGFVPQDAALIASFNRSHTSNVLLDWFDGSPPLEGFVLLPAGSQGETLWNRLWGAYIGSKPYEYFTAPRNEITLSTPAEYIERNLLWLVVDERDFTHVNDPQRLRDYLSDLLLVKTIPAENGKLAGSTLYVYRFELPNFAADYRYGETLRLVGYDLTATSIAPGETIRFRPYWRLQHPTQKNLTMYVHIYSAASVAAGTFDIVAQWDGEPITNGNRLTSLWNDTEEVYFGESFALTIPADTPPGDYVIGVGLYDSQTLARETAADGVPYYGIPITVNAP